MSSYFKFKLTDGIHEHDFLSIKESLNSYMIFSFMKNDNKEENIIDKEENIIDKKENIIDKKENIIDKKENIINKEESIIDKEENIIDKKENIINKDEFIINKDENIIYKKFIHSLDSLNFLEFIDKNKYDNIPPICLRYHKYIFSSISIFFIIKNIYFITK
jgi:hypothetical protein